MAHFAELGLDNIVKRVVVVHNNVLLDDDGVEQEHLGITFCENLFGGTWVQTSYNKNFRKRFAGIGYTYNSLDDVFVAPRPYASWSLDEHYDWQPPTPRPDDGNIYKWSEDDLTWIQI